MRLTPCCSMCRHCKCEPTHITNLMRCDAFEPNYYHNGMQIDLEAWERAQVINYLKHYQSTTLHYI